MTISNNSPLKIYYENIIDIIFLILTQYKFKIIFFLFPPFTCHSIATHHVWTRTLTLPFIYLFIYFPKVSISQGLIYTTPLNKISAPSQPLTSTYISLLSSCKPSFLPLFQLLSSYLFLFFSFFTFL